MSNLNWQKNSEGGHFAYTGRENQKYVIRKRNDGYYNVWFGSVLEDEIKLNKGRLRLGPAKQMAEDHHQRSKEDVTNPVVDPTVVDEVLSEDENSADPTKDTPTLPAVDVVNDSTTADVSPVSSDNPFDKVEFAPVTEDEVRHRLRSCQTKGERRRIRKQLRESGQGRLAGLAV